MVAIQLSCSNQAETFQNEIKKKWYKDLYESSRVSSGFFLSGPFVGIISGALTIAMRVGLIAESFFKGLANIFGAPFFESCHFSTGLHQLFIGTPLNIIILPVSAFLAVTWLFTKTVCTLINPSRYFHSKWTEYEKKKY